MCPDDDVVNPVAVDIAGVGDAVPESVADGFTGECP
jgi:hypothetical protein